MNEVRILILGTIALSAPLILAALGGLASERGGVIDIALEGKMLLAAAAAAIVGAATGSAWLGLASGIGASLILAWLHWTLTQAYRIDHIVSGMAINAIALGASNFMSQRFSSLSTQRMPTLDLWWYYVAVLVLPFAVAAYLASTRGGLWLSAIGNDPAKARQMGLDPPRVRFAALTVTGVFCGVAGVLIVSNSGYFTDEMTAGRGFIALAALILGRWKPLPAMLAALTFGFFQALQIQLQGVTQVPRELWYSLPYLVTVIALAGYRGANKAPAGAGKY